MDVRMPGIDGIEATRRLRAVHPPDQPPHVIILTTYDLDEYVYAGLHAGAAGFLLKGALDGELLQAVRRRRRPERRRADRHPPTGRALRHHRPTNRRHHTAQHTHRPRT
jgi:DNA-binding NarL/FixJ family response regulator